MSRPMLLSKFLLVEDDDDHAELVEFAIRAAAASIEIERARDGAEAIEILLERAHDQISIRPALVLLDLHLPRVDGVGVLEQLQADQTVKTPPTVMLTTSDASIDRARAYAAGVNSYLVKPLGFDELKAMMADTLQYWGRWNRTAA